jgi:uronate dehydrogenase
LGVALAALSAHKHGLWVLCLGFGHVVAARVARRRLSIWLSPEDLVQLVRIGLEHPDLRYEIFYGASNNERSWWDNARAYAYGYRPTGRAENHADAALAGQAQLPPDPVGDFFQGGPFCSDELDASRDDIWS